MSHQFTKIDPALLGQSTTSISDAWWNAHRRHAIAWVCDSVSLGAALRAIREKQSVSLREQAKKMYISAPYLSDLERGNRDWNRELVGTYIKVLPVEPERPSLKIGGTARALVLPNNKATNSGA